LFAHPSTSSMATILGGADRANLQIPSNDFRAWSSAGPYPGGVLSPRVLASPWVEKSTVDRGDRIVTKSLHDAYGDEIKARTIGQVRPRPYIGERTTTNEPMLRGSRSYHSLAPQSHAESLIDRLDGRDGRIIDRDCVTVDDARVPVSTDLELRNLDESALKTRADLLFRTLGPERVALSPPSARTDLLAWIHRVQRLHSRSELAKSVRPLERTPYRTPWRAPWLDSMHSRQQMTTEKDGTRTVRGLLGDEVQMEGGTQTTSALDQNTGEKFVHSKTRSLSPVGGALHRSSYLDDPIWRRQPLTNLERANRDADPRVRSTENFSDPLLHRHRRWDDQFLARTSLFCLDDPLLLRRSGFPADATLDSDVAPWRSSVRMA